MPPDYQRGAADGDFGPSCVESMDGWRLRRACSWLGQGMGLLGHGREGAVATPLQAGFDVGGGGRSPVVSYARRRPGQPVAEWTESSGTTSLPSNSQTVR